MQVTAVEIAVIELEPPSTSILVGDTVRFEAKPMDRSGNPLRGYDIDWSSSDPAAVAVDETGLVRGVAAGHATITAASSGSQATAEVTVNRPVPGLTSVQPSSAQRLETLDLVLTGSDFHDEATTVDLGDGITFEAVRVTGPGSIEATVTIRAGAQLGARDISVTNPPPGGGTASLTGGFTVLEEHPTPAVTQVSPADGQRQETLEVTLSGAGFDQDLTTVSFGADIAVSSLEVASQSSLTASIEIGSDASLGARDVSVTNPPPGGGTATLAGGFTVKDANPVPTLTDASPADGQRQATLDVTLTGSGFLDGMTTVSFGAGVSVDGVSVESSTALTATISIDPDAALGARDVSATNPAPGGGTARLAEGFTVRAENPSPTVTGASPSTGQRRDRLDVTLTGSGFVEDLTTITFGPEITVNAVHVNDATSLTADISIGVEAILGTRDVSATNPGPGGGTGTLTNGFTVLEENPAPTATMALPEVGAAGVTMDVTVRGSGFVQGLTTVSFGEGIAVNSVTVVLWTSLIANITIATDAASGPRDVSVTNPPPGGGTFIMHDGFRVVSAGGD